MTSWQIARPTETESRGKRRQLQPTTELVIEVARDAARRQAEDLAHNQNFMFRQRQAA
jgi:hypothetical protein